MIKSFKNLFSKKTADGKSARLNELENHHFFSLMNAMYNEGDLKRGESWENIKLKNIDSYEDVKKYPNSKKKELISYLIEYLHEFDLWNSRDNMWRSEQYWVRSFTYTLLGSLIKQKIDFEFSELHKMMIYANKHKSGSIFFSIPVHQIMIQIEKLAKADKLSKLDVKTIEFYKTWTDFSHNSDDARKALKRVNNILHIASGKEDELFFNFLDKDPFGKFWNEQINQIDDQTKINFFKILSLCSAASQSKPTSKFLKEVKNHIDELTIKRFKELVYPMFEFVLTMKPSENVVTYEGYDHTYTYYTFLDTENAKTIKGLVWCFSYFYDSTSLSLIARLGEKCYKKIPGVGPASAAVGNACVYTLASSRGLEGVNYLSRLKLVITQASARKLVQKYIDEISSKLKISSQEIEDMSTQDFDLVKGVKRIEFDDYYLELAIEKIGGLSQRWVKPDGSPQKTVPSRVKESKQLADKLKKVRAEIKTITKMVTTARDRIDRSFISNREMNWDYFDKYYLSHGLMYFIVKDLLWCFDNGVNKESGLLVDGQWQNVKGNTIDWINEETKVRLWHPAFFNADEILKWRDVFIKKEIKQPLKQVFREVYLLTPAEINTKVYSNRMAAHILKQHQFNALAAIRGWKYQLLGAFDNGIDSGRAIRDLPEYDMQVQFWIIELMGEDDFNDTGIWNFVSTDQVRFVNADDEPIELEKIPKIVLSEVLRDVDLFVGVCSVGNDPEWMDNGGRDQYRDYWQGYSFGDLSEIAKTRKTILENIVPKLNISDVATIDGKFLVVKGKLRTYKIHIGSTNILMEPNDQYLCIVPSRKKDSKTEKVFLPFEGDRGLSVIISKAFLLAADNKITDTTITSQINR